MTTKYSLVFIVFELGKRGIKLHIILGDLPNPAIEPGSPALKADSGDIFFQIDIFLFFR